MLSNSALIEKTVEITVAKMSNTNTAPYQGTNFNRKIASKFEGLFGYLSPEMLPFQALSGILLIV